MNNTHEMDYIAREFAKRPADVEHVELQTEKDGRASFMMAAIRGDRMRVLDAGFIITLSPVEVPPRRRATDELHMWERDIIANGDPWAHPSRAVGEAS